MYNVNNIILSIPYMISTHSNCAAGTVRAGGNHLRYLIFEHDLTMDVLLENGLSDIRCCYHSNIYQSLLVLRNLLNFVITLDHCNLIKDSIHVQAI